MHSFNIPKNFNGEVYKALETFDKRLYFRWDLTTDTVVLKDGVRLNRYDVPNHVENASSFFFFSGLLHQDDAHLVLTYLKIIYRHRYQDNFHGNTMKLRLKDRHKQTYCWVEIRLVTYFDGSQPVVAFGYIRNIQAQKAWQQRLEQAAERDTLTGLLNKETTRKRITNYLDTVSDDIDQCAMLLVDADGFKDINDHFGHLFGDAVITDMGLAIEHNFRHTDIKGRVGGDEFIILMLDVTDMETVKKRVTCLMQVLHRTYKSGSTELPFSISIGLALYPEHGLTYNELFKHADRALYEAKSKGKNRYMIYHRSLLDNASVTTHRSPENFVELQQRAFKDNMLEFILKLLYESNSPEATISLTLGMFGQEFGLDRVAVDDFNPRTNCWTNAYEWISPNGISQRGTELAELTAQKANAVMSLYRPSGYGVMSICEDTGSLPPQQRQAFEQLKCGAFAHCQITHGSEVLGCLSFETRQRHWKFTKEMLSDLNTFAVLLGNILLTNQKDSDYKIEVRHLRDLLDHMQEMIYVIDKDTMAPLYFNQTIRQAVSATADELPCYKLFHHLDAPCEDCPVLRLSDNGSEYLTAEVANWGFPTTTRAFNLRWEHANNCRLALIIQEPF